MFQYLLNENPLFFRASSASRSNTKQTYSPEPDFSLEGGKSTLTPWETQWWVKWVSYTCTFKSVKSYDVKAAEETEVRIKSTLFIHCQIYLSVKLQSFNKANGETFYLFKISSSWIPLPLLFCTYTMSNKENVLMLSTQLSFTVILSLILLWSNSLDTVMWYTTRIKNSPLTYRLFASVTR